MPTTQPTTSEPTMRTTTTTLHSMAGTVQHTTAERIATGDYVVGMGTVRTATIVRGIVPTVDVTYMDASRRTYAATDIVAFLPSVI